MCVYMYMYTDLIVFLGQCEQLDVRLGGRAVGVRLCVFIPRNKQPLTPLISVDRKAARHQ
jgi:hypothetical protein